MRYHLLVFSLILVIQLVNTWMAEELFDRSDAADLTGQLARLGARKLFQELLEAEVTAVLGRGPYERREDGQGYRNYKSGAF